MPARWASSERPLFVKTVWVNGYRHAILSEDDPLLRYPPPPPLQKSGGSLHCRPTSQSSASPNSCCDVSNQEPLEHCLIKLQLVLTTNHRGHKRSKKTAGNLQSQQPLPCLVRCCDIYRGIQEPRPKTAMVGQYHRPYLPNRFFSSSDDEEEESSSWRLDNVDGPLLPELGMNPLSERVLQWLDLAGKSGTTGDKNNSKDYMPRNRRARRRVGGAVVASAPVRSTGPRHAPLPCKVPVARTEFPPQMDVPDVKPLGVEARGLKSRRKRQQSFAARYLEALPPPSPPTPSIPPVLQTFHHQAPLPSTCRSPSERSRGKRQLHIFMPILTRDDESMSECSGSAWSES